MQLLAGLEPQRSLLGAGSSQPNASRCKAKVDAYQGVVRISLLSFYTDSPSPTHLGQKVIDRHFHEMSLLGI
jgi:hypothetical protein